MALRRMDDDARRFVHLVAQGLGLNPVDVASVVAYETGGTFDQWQRGPVTRWGQHRGRIQWGQPQRQRYGVYKGMPVEDEARATIRYLQDAGVQPGMGLLDIYSAVNAGQVGRYGASDRPGHTVRTHVAQMQRDIVPAVARQLGGDAAMAYAADATNPAAAITQMAVAQPQAKRSVKSTVEPYDPTAPMLADYNQTAAQGTPLPSPVNYPPSPFSLPGSTSRSIFADAPMGGAMPGGPGAPDPQSIAAANSVRRMIGLYPDPSPVMSNPGERLASLPGDMNPAWPMPAMPPGTPQAGAPMGGPPPLPGMPPTPRQRPPQVPRGPMGGGPFNMGGGAFQGVGYQGPPGPFSMQNEFMSPWMFEPPYYGRGGAQPGNGPPLGGFLSRLFR